MTRPSYRRSAPTSRSVYFPYPATLRVAITVSLWLNYPPPSLAFQATNAFLGRDDAVPFTSSLSPSARPFLPPLLRVCYSDLDADFGEMTVGGERYEMIPLPDSMVPTTLFVGNLCEFVRDEDLSDLFQRASVLRSVPACVARKPNTNSLRYGFVSFPTVEEKEAAIIRFHGYEWRGRQIKVEPIRDGPGRGRVRVPERMVTYVSGAIKRTRNGKTNTMRRIARNEEAVRNASDRSSNHRHRPKRGVAQSSSSSPSLPSSKRRGIHNNGSRPRRRYRLNEEERAELDRASRRGYVTVAQRSGGGRGRRVSALVEAHRQWCDARERPQIILFKAVGGIQGLDRILVDLSPLRIHGRFGGGDSKLEDVLVKWKTEIRMAAANAGMEQQGEKEAPSESDELSILLDKDDGSGSRSCSRSCSRSPSGEGDDISSVYVVTFDESNKEAWATKPISNLPCVSIGIFEGHRSNAKTMAKELAKMWNIPEFEAVKGEDILENHRGDRYRNRDCGKSAHFKSGKNKKKGHNGRTKMRGLSEHRRRGGGHRQSWF